ncbi:GNAT family N-acetyltransferase [Bacillus salacetis]|uniref:GNAT family N-acetyltransferase n=1 Tax=Bacillus salacetis TaxID=2315464 RepID=A0A3A1QXH6_9BACI|nr:GNAT family N-acetyltransferase [Bacillus salacetis]RIW31322.1 GNAT family N-acetyltransferase [Bacillus salacetis]
MNQDKYKVITYTPDYADETVRMWRESKERALGRKELHSFESHVYFLNHILPETHEVELVLAGGKVAGMMAFNESEISQLYIHVDYQGAGIGGLLLQRAKERSSGSLTLYTFEINENAQRFYEKFGFKVIGRGNDNEENLPDILYEWTSEG